MSFLDDEWFRNRRPQIVLGVVAIVCLAVGYWLASSFGGEWKSGQGGKLMFHSRTGEVRPILPGRYEP